MKPDLNKSVIYQIYPRTFTTEGTLKAAEKMIPHLYDMGIDIVYMSACNTEDSSVEGQSTRQKASGMNNPKNPYRISDYFSVDEEYGTIEDLRDFIQTAHSYGMKVLIDLVYFHCSANAVFLTAHPEFVLRDENGKVLIGDRWPFAVLNYEIPALREYMWSIMEFYMKELNADGFRCDVGDSVPLDFWAEGIRRVRAINPDAVMLNEGEDPAYLQEFDINYNFPTIYAISNLFLDLNHISTEEDFKDRTPMTIRDFSHLMDATYAEIPDGKFLLLNAENHDTASDLGEKRPEISLGSDAAEAILALLFTLKGVPMLYNGCEVADATLKNMFWNRFCAGNMSVQWENALTDKGKTRMRFLKNLIRIHKSYASIYAGGLTWTSVENDAILAFTREQGEQKLLIMVNTSDETQTIPALEVSIEKITLKKDVNLTASQLSFAPFGVLIAEVA